MGDPQAFRAIYEAHHAAVCAYFARRAPRDDVEDLAAETFTVAWRKLPRRLEHPLPWLYAVAGKVLANLKTAGFPEVLNELIESGWAPASND